MFLLIKKNRPYPNAKKSATLIEYIPGDKIKIFQVIR